MYYLTVAVILAAEAFPMVAFGASLGIFVGWSVVARKIASNGGAE